MRGASPTTDRSASVGGGARRMSGRRRGGYSGHVLVAGVLGMLVAGALEPVEARSPLLHRVQTWDQLTPDQRSKALQNFQKYQRLPESSRQRIDKRYERFQGLPPGEQENLRRNYDAYRNMTPQQRQNLNDTYRKSKGGSP